MASKKQKKKLAKAYNSAVNNAKVEPIVALKINGIEKQINNGTKIINRIAQSELGLDILNQAKDKDCVISFGHIAGGLAGNFDPLKNIVMVSTAIDMDKRAGVALHETAHFVQSCNGAFAVKDATSSVKSQLIGTRILEADAVAKEAVMCFQLNEKGDSEPWNILKNELPEITTQIEQASNKYGRDNTRMLLNAGFKAWFQDDFFKRSYEESTADFICRQIKNHEEAEGFNSKFFTNDIPLETIVAQCCTYNGEPYISPKKEFIEKEEYLSVSAQTIARIDVALAERQQKYPSSDIDHSAENLPQHDAKGKIIKLTPQFDTAARHNINMAIAMRNSR